MLCLPGYSPQATGSKNPQGQLCYACLPNKTAAGADGSLTCANLRPIDGAAGPAAPERSASPPIAERRSDLLLGAPELGEEPAAPRS